MDLFDLRTLFLFITILLLVRAAVMVYAWTLYPTYIPARYWALGTTLAALGTLLIGLRDLVPLWVSALGGNMLLLPGLMLVNAGAIRAAGLTPPLRLGALILAAVFSILAWNTLVEVNLQARSIAIVSTFILFDLAMAAYCFSAKPGQAQNTLRMLGVLGIINVAASALRLYWVFVEPLGWLLSPHWANSLSLLIYGSYILASTGIFCLLASQWLQEQIDHQAKHDSLTGALNRRGLKELAERELIRASRSGEPVSFLMMDIDHFKRVNDVYGHDIGDATLREVSHCAQQAMRPIDSWCRYGGEEFVAMLPRTGLNDAVALAERLRKKIESISIQTDSGALQVTVSLGVASYSASHESWLNTVAHADEAMYQAKQSGRNRVHASQA